MILEIKSALCTRPKTILTHFMQLVSFYTPLKHQKVRIFIVFTGHRKRSVAWNGLGCFLKKKSKGLRDAFCSIAKSHAEKVDLSLFILLTHLIPQVSLYTCFKLLKSQIVFVSITRFWIRTWPRCSSTKPILLNKFDEQRELQNEIMWHKYACAISVLRNFIF